MFYPKYPKYPNDELKACPCCGITASFSQNSEYIGGHYVYNAWIQCKNRNCGLMIPAKPIDDDNKDEVIASLMAKWNKRDEGNERPPMVNTWVRDVTKPGNKKFYIDEMVSYKSGKVELHAKLCKDSQLLINCDYWLNLEDCVEVNEE